MTTTPSGAPTWGSHRSQPSGWAFELGFGFHGVGIQLDCLLFGGPAPFHFGKIPGEIFFAALHVALICPAPGPFASWNHQEIARKQNMAAIIPNATTKRYPASKNAVSLAGFAETVVDWIDFNQ
jgi:hypothetical protein